MLASRSYLTLVSSSVNPAMMECVDMDDAALARHRYSYDPETGEFLWRNPPPKAPKSKAVIGSPAGTGDRRDGNRQINLDGRIHPAARVAWLIVHGTWPEGQVCYEDPSLPLPTRDRISNIKLSRGREEVTQEYLRRIMDYDPETGVFCWRVARKGVRAGAVAGGMRKTSDGLAYWYIRIDGIDYPAHRLAWLYTHGRWPELRLSFRNGRSADCSLNNLVEGEFQHGTRQAPALPEDERKRRLRETYRRSDLKKSFGLTVERYQAMHDAQDGRCAICGQVETMERGGKVRWLAVDHDHKDGHVRELLCSGCNVGLGNFGDDPARLRAAAEYLERHAAGAASEASGEAREVA